VASETLPTSKICLEAFGNRNPGMERNSSCYIAVILVAFFWGHLLTGLPIAGSDRSYAVHWHAVQYVCLARGRSLLVQVDNFFCFKDLK